MTPESTDGPAKPLTPTELKVSRLVGAGADYATIGYRLGMSEITARVHVYHIAAKLPNVDGLKPYTLVLLWSAHQRWLLELESAA